MHRLIPAIVLLEVTLAPLAFGQHKPVEQTLAGITVGKTSMADFVSKFGTAKLGNTHSFSGCTLAANADPDKHLPPKVVTDLTLRTTIASEPISTECTTLQTSKKIGLGSTLKEIFDSYGKPRFDAVNKKGIRLLRFDNSWTCDRKHPRPIILKSLYIQYDMHLKRVIEISLETAPYLCDNLE